MYSDLDYITTVSTMTFHTNKHTHAHTNTRTYTDTRPHVWKRAYTTTSAATTTNFETPLTNFVRATLESTATTDLNTNQNTFFFPWRNAYLIAKTWTKYVLFQGSALVAVSLVQFSNL